MPSWSRREALAELRQTFEDAESQTSRLANLVFSRQTSFFECEHLFFDKPMVITEPAIANVLSGTQRQFTTSFGENVVVAKTSYQMLEILLFNDRERAQPPSMEISVLTLVVKKSTMKLSVISVLENRRECLKFNVALVLESLY